MMPPIDGAIEAYAALARRFDTYILSTAPSENASAWRDKLRWVKTHLGADAYKRLILTHHKNLNVGDYLIDDRTKNGVDRFKTSRRHSGQIALRDDKLAGKRSNQRDDAWPTLRAWTSIFSKRVPPVP